MTPEKAAQIREHAKKIAALLYEEAPSERLKTFAGIEATVREQVLEYVSPEIAIFLSKQRQKSVQGELGESKVSLEN